MTVELNFALVGCGHIASRHARVISDLKEEGARLVGVCDTNWERAQAFGLEFDVPFYTSFEELSRQQHVDVWSVLTPSGTHAEVVIRLANFGGSILVEKPMALRLSDADRMIAACDEASVSLFVMKQMRLHRPVQRLKEMIDAGALGRLVMCSARVRWCRPQEYYDKDSWRGTWALDGGVISNQASHHIDLLLWMMGDVKNVQATSSRALVDIEAEDTAIVILEFESGALGVIEATTAARPRNIEGSVSVLGELGMVELGGMTADKILKWELLPLSDNDVNPDELANPAGDGDFGHREYYRKVIECIKTGGRPLVDGLVGRHSLELISAIYEAIETGRKVPLRFSPSRCKLGVSED